MSNKKYGAAIEYLIYESKEHKISITAKGDYLRYNDKVYKKDDSPKYSMSRMSKVKLAGLYWLLLPNEGCMDKGYNVAIQYNNSLFYNRIWIRDKNEVVNIYFRDPLKE